MPVAAPSACSQPGCPNHAADRGRCAAHRMTTSDRGYGTIHKRERTAALPGAKCERCGCTRELHRDHVTPTTLGGSQAPANKRWLCDCAEHRCHSRYGLKVTSRRAS